MPSDPSPAPRRRWRPSRALLAGLALLAVVAAAPPLAVGVAELREHRDVRRVALQFAGGHDAACRVIQPGAAGCPVPEAAVRRYQAAVRADGWLLAGLVLAGLGVFGLGALFLYGSGPGGSPAGACSASCSPGPPTSPPTWPWPPGWPASAAAATAAASPWPRRCRC